MLAALPAAETIAVVVAAVVGALWGVPAVLGWRQVADARKERIAEIEGALGRAEETIVTLNKRITELEALPDLSQISEDVRARHAEVLGCVREVKEAVDEIAKRWG